MLKANRIQKKNGKVAKGVAVGAAAFIAVAGLAAAVTVSSEVYDAIHGNIVTLRDRVYVEDTSVNITKEDQGPQGTSTSDGVEMRSSYYSYTTINQQLHAGSWQYRAWISETSADALTDTTRLAATLYEDGAETGTLYIENSGTEDSRIEKILAIWDLGGDFPTGSKAYKIVVEDVAQ